jgi:hypothetical protein
MAATGACFFLTAAASGSVEPQQRASVGGCRPGPWISLGLGPRADDVANDFRRGFRAGIDAPPGPANIRITRIERERERETDWRLEKWEAGETRMRGGRSVALVKMLGEHEAGEASSGEWCRRESSSSRSSKLRERNKAFERRSGVQRRHAISTHSQATPDIKLHYYSCRARSVDKRILVLLCT